MTRPLSGDSGRDINRIANLITEDATVFRDLSLTPKKFVNLLNSVVASSPHGRQELAVANLCRRDWDTLARLSSTVAEAKRWPALKDYLSSSRTRLKALCESAGQMFNGHFLESTIGLLKMVESVGPVEDDFDAPGETETEEESDDDGEFYYDAGDDSDGH